MADTKITALAAIATVDPAADVLPIVDISDTSMAATGTTKKVTSNQILGAGGTATLASASITGAATVGTTLGVTGASTLTGSVGIGAASSAKLSVTDTNGIPIRFGDLAAAPASQTACFVGTATGAFTGNGNGDLILVPRTSDTRDVAIYTGSGTAADRLRVTAAGNVNISTGNVVMATSGKGIDFSAVTGGTGTATGNVLNDYEEGTWVGTLVGSTTNPTVAVTATGRYTKVGRQVSVQIAFEGVSNIGASGAVGISGLPFTNAALRTIGTAGTFTGATFTGTLVSVISASSSLIDIYGVLSNSSWNAATHNASATTYFWANLTYTV